MWGPAQIAATRESAAIPDKYDILNFTTTVATKDISSCGDAVGGKDLRGKWVYLYASANTVTIARGPGPIVATFGLVLAAGESARVFIPDDGETDLTLIGGGTGALTIAYASNP